MPNDPFDLEATTVGMRSSSQPDASSAIFGNGSSASSAIFDCDEWFQEFLVHNRLVFEGYHMVRIVVTWIIFVISAVGNTFVLLSVTVRRKSKDINHIQLMMMHLSLANLAFTFFILPMDAVWQMTLQWLAGDFLCRLLNMLKQFSMYISSAVIVVMGIDKVTSLTCPVSHNRQRKRIKYMLIFAWGFSFLNSIFGLVLFSARSHSPIQDRCPEHQIVQCVDFKLVKGIMLQLFYFYSMSLSFFIPVVCIIACYIIIAIWLRKMSKTAKATEIQSAGFRPLSKKKSLARQGLHRARKITLIVTGLITTVFLICWGPYYVIGFFHWYKKEKPDKIVEAAMIMCSYLNPCLHPLITVMLLKDIRKDVLRMLPCTDKSTRSSSSTETARKATI